MARGASALWLLFCFGCANPARPIQETHLDFGLDTEMPDLSVPETDLANPGLDFASTSDAAPSDAAPPDLKPPPSCDDAGTRGHLFLAGVGAANALITASFTEAGGWTAYHLAAAPNVSQVAQTLVAARPLLVARETDGTLAETAADPCTQQFPTLAPIGVNVKTALRPSVLGGSQTDVVYRVTSDNHLAYLYRLTSSWVGATQQNNMQTTLPFALGRFDGALHAIFSDGGALKDGLVSGAVGGGAAPQIGTLTTSQPPTAIVDGSGKLHVVFVGGDTNLYWISRAPGGSWSAEHQLCEGQSGCLIDTTLPIALTLDAAGAPSVAWVGITNHQVFTATLVSASAPFWSAAQLASGSCATKDCQTTVGPALATGLGAARLELVFVSDLDGRARHARLLPVDMGQAWAEPMSISGTNLLDTPALTAEP